MANPSSRSGQRLGAYEVGPLIGAGGMGEVYRARDTTLNREVAIKVLLAAVANDAERLARFRREAQTLASLNHPGIAQIHGLEDSGSGPFLVMELVDGPTLADRLATGPLPIDEALAIARQIADALEAAHERGIIHRDLKPANIKVCDDGTVKVLDFGLAKALDPSSGIGEPGIAANSPTITTPAMTAAGLILGTAAYMSPEQAKGRVVDKRTDVWAFGCVLYEMLTGRRAFDGEDVTDTIAAIVRGEPNWNAVPKDTPPQVRLLLKRCLEKDRRARISDAGVARFLLTESLEFPHAAITGSLASPRASRARLAAAMLVGLTIGATLVAGGWSLMRRPAPASPVRFTIVPPPELALWVQGNDRDVVIAPDGSFIVYRTNASSQAQLVMRPLGELDGRILPGTTGARSPVISPDGRWVGFAAQGELRKVAVSGGPPATICKIDSAVRGISWGDDDTIVFSTAATRALKRVPARGGEPEALTTPDLTQNESHFNPFVLPGSQALLFTRTYGTFENPAIQALDLKTLQQKTVLGGGADASVQDGVMLYATARTEGPQARLEGVLRATRFDARTLEVSGESVTVIDHLNVVTSTIASYAVSGRGDLVYLPAGAQGNQEARRSLVWLDRKGREDAIPAPPRGYAVARISPDQTRVALDVRDATSDIWIWDFRRQTLVPLHRDAAADMSPLWTPDGSRIVWTSTRGGGNPNLYWQAADGTGTAARLMSQTSNQLPTSISPDGSQLIWFGTVNSNHTDLFRTRLKETDRKTETLIGTPSMEFGGEISPDGRWLAYHSNESGEYQVLVRPFPNIQDGRVQVSTAGGTRPAWAPNGRELFYLDAEGFLTSVTVRADATTFVAERPVKILSTAYVAGRSGLGLDLRAYDVSSDGQRFLMIKETAPAEQRDADTGNMIVVLNWLAEVKTRLSRP